MDTNRLTVKLQTLTPLWTGGVETGKMDRIHETGIIGSLRWWYEAIVRGLGGNACDPVSRNRKTPLCKFDQKEYQKVMDKSEEERLTYANLCTACRVFGATGWKRRFSLYIEDHTAPTWADTNIILNVRPPGRTRGWYISSGRTGDIYFHLSGHEKTLSRIASLFLFLEKYGAIGAKTQHGYGLFQITNREDVARMAGSAVWRDTDGQQQGEAGLPDLRHFGFFHFSFKPSNNDWWSRVNGLERLFGSDKTAYALKSAVKKNMVPVSPAIRNEWRYNSRSRPAWVDSFFFGTSRGKELKIRSKLAVSWAFSQKGAWHVRGWAWLPPKDDRDQNINPDHIRRLWQTICDINHLKRILHAETASFSAVPDCGEWKTHRPKDIIKLLENQ